LLPLQQSALQRLILTPNPLPADLPVSTGLLGSRCGMSAQSLMVRIILLPHAYSPKHGAKFFAIRRPRWSSPFSRTKTCPGSAKRSRRSLIQFFFRKFAANAPLILRRWQRFWLTLVRHSPTPSLHLSVKPSISRARSQI